MSKEWTPEQRAKYNEANKARQAEIRRIAKAKKEEVGQTIKIVINSATPELIEAIIKAMEGK